MLSIGWNVIRRRVRVLTLLVAIPVTAAVTALVVAGRSASAASAPAALRIDLAAGSPSVAPGYRLSLTEAVVPPDGARTLADALKSCVCSMKRERFPVARQPR